MTPTPTPAPLPRNLVRFGVPGVVLALGLLFTLGMWRHERSVHQREVNTYFDYRSRDAVARVEARLRTYEQALLSARGLFQASETVTRGGFATFVTEVDVDKHFPGIQGIGFAVVVPAAELDRHLVQIRRQGFPDYSIRPAGKRAIYSSIIYLEPFKERNLRAFGYNMFAEPVRQEAMRRATDSGAPALSGKVQLVQETDQAIQAGFLLYVPVYQNGRATQTIEDRRRNLLGWVYAPFRMNDFMVGVLGEGAPDMDLEIFDGPVASAGTQMFDRDPAHAASSSALPQARQTLSFAGHSWSVATQALPTLIVRHGQDTSARALGLGILVSLLLGLTAFLFARHLDKVRSLNATLEQKVQERTQALGERELHFRIMADYTYDWELWEDPGGAILYCSPSCERITGYGPDAFTADLGLLERLLHPEDRPDWQAHRAKVHAATGSKEPALMNGDELTFRLLRPDCEVRWIGHVCHPIHNAAGRFLGHRISNRDITERKQAEIALRTSEENLAITLHSIGDAVIATDVTGLITRMNPTAERLTGWPLADALGQPLMEVFRILNAQTRVPSVNPVNAVLARGEVVGLANHTLLIARDGQEYQIADSAAPIRDAAGRILGVVLVFSDVTEQYRVETALREAHELLTLFVHYSPIYTYIKDVTPTESRILQASENFEQMIGIKGSDMVGKTVEELFPTAMAEKINADDWAVVSDGKVMELSEEFNGRSYTTFKFPIVQGEKTLLAGFTIDITERKESEGALRISEEQFRLLFQKAPLGNGIIDSHTGQLLAVNPRYAQIVGRTLTQMTTIDWMSFTHPDDIQGDLDQMARMNAGAIDGYQMEKRYLQPDGEVVWVNMTIAALRDASTAARHYVMVDDITEHKKSEAVQAELETQNHHLQKAESLGLMAASIAHHFNNKLQAVLANLEVASRLPKGEDPAKYLAMAKLASVKAAEVSRQMLVYLGNSPGERDPLFLVELCRASLPHLQDGLPGSVTLATECPAPGPVINANAEQLQQVLTQLVTNAWEAMGEAGGRILLRVNSCPAADIPAAHRFPIGWQPQGLAYACLEVADTGCGIANADIEKLFDPFFSTKFTGRGLGLPVALGIVQAHGGGITVESRPGQGSILRSYFPVSTEGTPSLPERAVQAPEHAGGGTLLLVDDDEMLLMSTGALVDMLGFTLLTAKDGVEALEVFHQHQAEIRCVLTDLTMPRLDGWGLLSALRKLDPNLPVILASGYDKAQVLAGSHPDRPQAFLSKPFDLQQLRDAVNEALAPGSTANAT